MKNKILPTQLLIVNDLFLKLISGGDSKTKKVNLKTALHPSIAKSLDIIKGSFERLCLRDQDILADSVRWNKVRLIE